MVVLPLPRQGVAASGGAGRGSVDGVHGSATADVGTAQMGGPAGAGDTGDGAPPAEDGAAGRSRCRCSDSCCPAGEGTGTGAVAGGAASGAGPGQARVEIAAGGHAVVVDAPEPLGVVADTAVRLWTVTDPPDLVRGYGFAGTTGDPTVVDTPFDVTMPPHLTDPTEGTDE